MAVFKNHEMTSSQLCSFPLMSKTETWNNLLLSEMSIIITKISEVIK